MFALLRFGLLTVYLLQKVFFSLSFNNYYIILRFNPFNKPQSCFNREHWASSLSFTSTFCFVLFQILSVASLSYAVAFFRSSRSVSLPSFVVCHVVHSAQLFKKCWISTMAFTGALSTFVWSNLGWMRWLPVQGGLGSVLLRNGRLPLACPSLSSRLKAARFESTRLSPAKQPAGRLKMQRKGFRRAAVQW